MAKLDHFLLRAEELMRIRRYLAAKNTLQKVYALDSENRAAKSVEKRIEYVFSTLAALRRSNGSDPEILGENGKRHRRGQIVLIVDQDERVLEDLSDKLTAHGFDVLCAASYQEALETATRFIPHIVISEVNFENGSVGFDLYLWIRTNTGTSDTPFLFLATRIDRDMLIAGKKLGVNDFILKPLDTDVVTASVLHCLTNRRDPRR